MSELASGYLPQRTRPAGFSLAIVVLFVAMLLVPLAGAFLRPDSGIASFEKRRAEGWPELRLTRPGLKAFPAEFERYFNDHFGSRGTLIALDHWAKAVVFGISPVPEVMIGTDGWLYFLGEDGKALERWYRGSEAFAEAEIVGLRTELLRRRDYLAHHGIPYVVVVIPEKYSVYPEFLPQWVQRLTPQTRLDRIAEDLSLYPRLRFIDLRGALRAAKASERVYYQTDSHWNYLGATVGYRALMTELLRVLPAMTMAPPQRPPYVRGADYYSGDLAQMLGLPKRFREDDIAPLAKILASPDSRCARRETEGETPGFEIYVYRCNPRPRYSALVYRDSMAIPLIPMLSENFRRVTYVSSRQLDPALVERERPDVVIEQLVERSLTAPAALPMPMPTTPG